MFLKELMFHRELMFLGEYMFLGVVLPWEYFSITECPADQMHKLKTSLEDTLSKYLS